MSRIPFACFSIALLGSATPLGAQTLPPVWQAQFDGAAHWNDYATSVALMPSGKIAVAGSVFTEPQQGLYVPQMFTALYSPQGALLWSREHGSGYYGGNGWADEVAVAPGNKIVSAGTRDLGSTVMLAQYDEAGNFEWEGLWLAGSYWVAYVEDLDVDSLGDSYVCSNISSGAGVAKFGPGGALLWSRVFTGTGLEIGSITALALSAAGDVFLTGSTPTPGGATQFSVARIDPATGAPLWIRQRGPTGSGLYSTGSGLGADAAGNALAGGRVARTSGQGADLSFAAYAPDGTLLWSYDHTGPGSISGTIEDLQVDAGGGIAAVGSTQTAAGDLDGFALRMNGSQFAWVRTFGGAAQLEDHAVALELDGLGGLVAAARIQDPGLSFDVYQYGPSGILLSHGRTPVPDQGDGYARGLALGSASRAYLAGDMGSFPGANGDGVLAAFDLGVQLSTSFCFGDGTDPSPCPCGNSGAAGHGCENSDTTGGALLAASGMSNPDTLVFHSTGELQTALSIFLQGNQDEIPGLSFGDGLRCASGALRRLYVKNASAGAVSAPEAGEPSVTARSAELGDPIAPGSSRSYQVYYRDPDLGFCPPPQGDSWNVTNALRIQW